MQGYSSVAIDSMKQAARRPSPPLPRPASGSCSASLRQSCPSDCRSSSTKSSDPHVERCCSSTRGRSGTPSRCNRPPCRCARSCVFLVCTQRCIKRSRSERASASKRWRGVGARCVHGVVEHQVTIVETRDRENEKARSRSDAARADRRGLRRARPVALACWSWFSALRFRDGGECTRRGVSRARVWLRASIRVTAGRPAAKVAKSFFARMAKLVDAPDLGSGSERSGGSSPLPRTEAKPWGLRGSATSPPAMASATDVLTTYYLIRSNRHHTSFEPMRTLDAMASYLASAAVTLHLFNQAYADVVGDIEKAGSDWARRDAEQAAALEELLERNPPRTPAWFVGC